MADAPAGGDMRARWAAVCGDVLLTALAAALAGLSFAGDGAPYLFPRILAVLLLLLCLLQIANVLRGGDDSVNLAQIAGELRRALPAVAVVVVYIALAETLGFYLAALPAYLSFVLVGGTGCSLRQVAAAALAALLFTAVLYGLFSVLLYVQTPRGILF